MPVIPFLPAIVGIGGSIIGAVGANKAANTQAKAAEAGSATLMSMYNQTRSDLAPYMSTGNSALSQLAAMFGLGGGVSGGGGPGGGPNPALAMSNLTQFPGYQFGFGQGLEALDHSAASRGMVLSSNQLQNATKFGNDYAMSQAWTPYITQLQAMANAGQNAASSAGGFGATAAGAISNNQLAAGQARAAGQVGVTNAITGGLGNALQAGQQAGWWGLGNGGGGITVSGGGTQLPSINDPLYQGAF